MNLLMFRSITRFVVPLLACYLFPSWHPWPTPNKACPINHRVESADNDAIHFSKLNAGQDHEVGGRDARDQVQLPANERGTLVCRDPESCGGHILHIVFKRQGEANPISATEKVSKTEIMAYLKGSFDYCDGVYSGFTDAHLNDPANFFGAKTNKMFILTQVGNHDALHCSNRHVSANQPARTLRRLVLTARRRTIVQPHSTI